MNNNSITRFQLIFLLFQSQVGVGIVTLPHEIYMVANRDGWISILLSGLLVQIMVLIYGMLLKRFPSSNFYEIVQIILGKWLGKVIIFIITLYFIILGGIILARFSVIISAWMMPLTPKWILAAVVILTAMYIAVDNLQIISRFMFIATFTFPIYISFAIYALKDANITYILPIGSNGVIPVLKGMASTFWTLHGVELLLFIYPFIQADHRETIKTASLLNVFITLYYTAVMIASLLILSPEKLKIVPEPVIYIVKSFSFKVVERPDLIITSLWIVIVVTTFIVIIYISSLGLSVFLNKNRTKIIVFIVTTLSYISSLFVTGVYEVDTLGRFFAPFTILFIFIIPIIFLILSILMKKKECENSE